MMVLGNEPVIEYESNGPVRVDLEWIMQRVSAPERFKTQCTSNVRPVNKVFQPPVPFCCTNTGIGVASV